MLNDTYSSHIKFVTSVMYTNGYSVTIHLIRQRSPMTNKPVVSGSENTNTYFNPEEHNSYGNAPRGFGGSDRALGGA